MKPLVIGIMEFEYRTRQNNKSSTFKLVNLSRFSSKQQQRGSPLVNASSIFELPREKLVGKVNSVVTDKIEFEHRDGSISIVFSGQLKLSQLRHTEKRTVFKMKFLPEKHYDWGFIGRSQPCCYRERRLWRSKRNSRGLHWEISDYRVLDARNITN